MCVCAFIFVLAVDKHSHATRGLRLQDKHGTLFKGPGVFQMKCLSHRSTLGRSLLSRAASLFLTLLLLSLFIRSTGCVPSGGVDTVTLVYVIHHVETTSDFLWLDCVPCISLCARQMDAAADTTDMLCLFYPPDCAWRRALWWRSLRHSDLAGTSLLCKHRKYDTYARWWLVDIDR